MPKLIMPIFTIAFVVIFVFGIIYRVKKDKQNPASLDQQKSKQIKGNLITGAIVSVSAVIMVITNPNKHSFVPYMFFGLAILNFYIAFHRYIKKEKPTDYYRAFEANANACGRCNYNLTNLESDTCPECGWLIPDLSTVQFQSRYTWYWWKQWRIDYLEQPRLFIMSYLFTFLFFFPSVLIALFLFHFYYSTKQNISEAIYSTIVSPAIVIFIITIMQTINMIRVLQYLSRKQSPENTNHKIEV